MKSFVTIYAVAAFALAVFCLPVAAQVDVTVTDMTPVAPLQTPIPSTYEPRYISGFGSGDSFTLFFEDRAQDYQVYYLETTDGINGFPGSATRTDLRDTHLCVKDWPINIDGTVYAYRAWGALWNTADHHFYVSNNLTNWTLVSKFTIPSNLPEGVPGGIVYYGFHDVIELNGTYYAWGECNIGYTLICRSINGADDWEAFDCVGGLFSGPLQLPGGEGPTPTGNFFELGYNRGYGKIMVPCDNSAFYLAINTAARPSLPDADLEAAFINPNNWTWHDGTTGLPTTAILREDGHDLRECWLVPNGEAEWTIMYDADYGSDYGDKALGYATLAAPLLYLEVDIDIKPGSDLNPINADSKGVIPVAILTTEDFDASTVDPDSIMIAGRGVAVRGKGSKSMSHLEDVDGDGDMDLLVQVDTYVEDEPWDTGRVDLTGETFDSTPITGHDYVLVLPTEL